MLRRVCLLPLGLLGCGPQHPGGLETAGELSESGSGLEGSTQAEDTASPDEPDLPPEPAEPDLPPEPEPDLPPERTCVPFEQATEFADLCFEAPEIIDPQPVSYLAHTWPGDSLYNYYVGGLGVHRFYRHSELQVNGSYVELAITGVTVEAKQFRPHAGQGIFFGIITRDPHMLVVLDVLNDLEVVAELELEVEPTAFGAFRLDPEDTPYALALVDVDANLHVFELEMGSLVQTSTRALPEPLDRLEAIPWLWVDGRSISQTQMIGLSNASLTAWHLDAPIHDGPVDGYPLPTAISTWALGPFSHVPGNTSRLLFSVEPSEATFYKFFDFDQPFGIKPMVHPVEKLSWGYVPWGLGGMFVLSRADAKIAHLATGNGEGTEFVVPHWIDAAPDTSDFLAVGELGFLCASTSAGLTLISPKR